MPSICIATEYDEFNRNIKIGLSSEQIKEYLDKSNTPYHYYTCEETKKIVSSEKIECKYNNSKGIFKGLSNDGSYVLGIGSSDVSFQIEIGSDEKAVEIRTDYVYTFL